VREALSIVIDRETIKRNTMRGLSIPAAIMVAPGVNGHTTEIDTPPKVDVERAKKLLADAGYPNGFEFQLNCPNNRYVNDEEICQATVAMWARIGIKVRLVAESMATFIQKVQNFDTSAYMLGWGVATYDAQYTLQSLIRTRTTGVAQLAAEILRSLNRGNPLPFDAFEKQVLQQRGLTAADFERFLRHEVGMQQLISAAGISGKLVTPQDAKAWFAILPGGRTGKPKGKKIVR
jgi:ABC-type transport system substrate-binding protein